MITAYSLIIMIALSLLALPSFPILEWACFHISHEVTDDKKEPVDFHFCRIPSCPGHCLYSKPAHFDPAPLHFCVCNGNSERYLCYFGEKGSIDFEIKGLSGFGTGETI